jgi:murein DD-endopeptidase MepM/ murein hydrolase activator NlpD
MDSSSIKKIMKKKFNKDFYFFDKETFTYKKEPKNFIYYLRTYWILISSAIFFAFLFIYLFLVFYDDSSVLDIEQKNQALEIQIAENQKAIDEIKTFLDTLSEKNKVVYKVILGSDYEEDTTNTEADSLTLKEDASWEKLEEEIKKLREKVYDQTNNQSMLYQLATEKRAEIKAIPSIRPIPSEIISGFGTRIHPIRKEEYQHNGIDFKADVGTNVMATGDGYIMEIGQNPNDADGIYIIINHGFGYTTKYAHLSKILVPRYAQVKRGQVIAKSGKTGIAKGPHLHYEIRKNYKPIDPIDYFFSDLSADDFTKIKKQTKAINESMD